jgi:subtilisin family serine protease
LISSSGFDDTGSNLVIVKTSGGTRFLHLSAVRGRLAFATEGQISGHTAAQGALSIAAVRASTANGPGGTFDGTEQVESFSSDGPRRVFFAADGSAFPPDSFPPNAFSGQLRAKPDLTAADCVDTSSPGFGTFCGTSAAAPHAAAIAALLLEAGTGRNVTQADVIVALKRTALDIEAFGDDRDSGAGIIDAHAAAQQIIPALDAAGLVVLVGAIAAAGVRSTRYTQGDLPTGSKRSLRIVR